MLCACTKAPCIEAGGGFCDLAFRKPQPCSMDCIIPPPTPFVTSQGWRKCGCHTLPAADSWATKCRCQVSSPPCDPGSSGTPITFLRSSADKKKQAASNQSLLGIHNERGCCVIGHVMTGCCNAFFSFSSSMQLQCCDGALEERELRGTACKHICDGPDAVPFPCRPQKFATECSVRPTRSQEHCHFVSPPRCSPQYDPRSAQGLCQSCNRPPHTFLSVSATQSAQLPAAHCCSTHQQLLACSCLTLTAHPAVQMHMCIISPFAGQKHLHQRTTPN